MIDDRDDVGHALVRSGTGGHDKRVGLVGQGDGGLLVLVEVIGAPSLVRKMVAPSGSSMPA